MDISLYSCVLTGQIISSFHPSLVYYFELLNLFPLLRESLFWIDLLTILILSQMIRSVWSFICKYVFFFLKKMFLKKFLLATRNICISFDILSTFI